MKHIKTIAVNKLFEFKNKPGLDKFDEYGTAMFSDGYFMGQWFKSVYYFLEGSSNPVCMAILKEYGKYIESVDESKELKYDVRSDTFAMQECEAPIRPGTANGSNYVDSCLIPFKGDPGDDRLLIHFLRD